MIEGLPPGPIGNPGRAAIEAVLEPADAPYLFFVSKNDGTHFFSESLDEHNIAVGRYQKSGQDVSPESDCFSDCAGAEPITPQARK
ncbi:MAG: hypothetical protein A2521_03590 [Deltaproteobacteria bacterium RIFOXYD12_FULL_57_12]|nr:MAG: hypothetical protein A2521_03590 [Deltaproteobacteria bacterium RIFOXYD12_FULL_57_12]